MAIKYVTPGAWGAGLGRVLTASEADTNIYSLEQAIQNLIDNPVAGVSVSNIAVVGRQVTFYMTDATTYGPFDLPVSYPVFRGEWQALYSYTAFDIVTANGYGTYLVLQDHVSAAAFDPAANNTSGDYYVKIASDPQALTETVTIAATTLTLDATHAGKYLRFVDVSGCAVTVPKDVFGPNVEIHFRAVNGPVSIAPGTDVTINAQGTDQFLSNGTGTTFSIKRVAANVFDIFGNLAPGE